MSCLEALCTRLSCVEVHCHSVISECQVTTDTVNWTVSGSCRVQEAFSSDNVYSCSWTLSDQISGSLSEDRERCLFTQQLPKVVDKYTYNVSVFPPATSESPQTIEIASPGDLSIFCPRVVLLGSSFVVACETETAGSPSAIVRLEGEKDRQKVIRSVPRSANGTQFRCHVTWGGDTNSTSYYTLLVALYKPSIDGPDIVSIRSSSPSNSANTSLVCSASEAYPAVIYSWQGACAEVTTSVDGSTCLVSRPISDTDVITCTAVNSLFDISVTTSYSPGLTGTHSLIAAAVGGAAAGVIILTAVIVVVVLYILRKRKDAMYASTTMGREEPHPYMDLEMRGQGHCETAPTSSDLH
ncbi:uncharacterized protein LOC112567526 [Pomacea canaliculata]|uniref:uncharacterized protein LOC112567526 n=1 Tax=Pomacea canaliculata TaxID=400727 RepID=UPI000D72E7C4|nr:uncharacterized protein LOC112567526 [Pomacea canaliculata]